MAKNIIYILGNEKFDRFEVPSDQQTKKFGGITYRLLHHKKLVHRRWRSSTFVWFFKAGRSTPLDVAEIKRRQKYKKFSPSALKIVVSQNIEHTFFKSLLDKRGFAGLGRRRVIALFIVVGVAVIALKVLGYY